MAIAPLPALRIRRYQGHPQRQADALMTEFNQKLDDWIRRGSARIYFKARDETALPALERVMAALPPPPDDDRTE